MDLALAGRRAIVTGASRGIGRAIALGLAAEGVSVALCSRSTEGVRDVLHELTRLGADAIGEAVDVADADRYRTWLCEAASALGGVDIFVHNPSAQLESGEDAWRLSFEIDLMGLVRGVETLLPYLQSSPAPSVIGICSTLAVEIAPQPSGSYGACKAAMLNHTADLAQSLGAHRIRVNAVSPGPVEFVGGEWARLRDTRPEEYERSRARVALGRMGTPEDIAGVVTFLASPAAGFVTGSHIVVDGGFTKRVS